MALVLWRIRDGYLRLFELSEAIMSSHLVGKQYSCVGKSQSLDSFSQ
jgi:hypothetical protein